MQIQTPRLLQAEHSFRHLSEVNSIIFLAIIYFLFALGRNLDNSKKTHRQGTKINPAGAPMTDSSRYGIIDMIYKVYKNIKVQFIVTKY